MRPPTISALFASTVSGGARRTLAGAACRRGRHAAASVGDERPSGGEIAPAGVQARLAASPCPARGNSECESSIDLGWRTPTLLKQRERGSAQRRAFCIRGQSAAEVVDKLPLIGRTIGSVGALRALSASAIALFHPVRPFRDATSRRGATDLDQPFARSDQIPRSDMSER